MLMTKAPKIGKKKCFIHEMRLPVDLRYDRFQHHICRHCQSRLQELADVNFQFSHGEQIITISVTTQIQDRVASPERNGKASKKQRVQKEEA